MFLQVALAHADRLRRDLDQLVVLDISLYDGTTGQPLVKTAYDGSDSSVFSLARWSETFPSFAEALHCATPGTRTVVALPPDGIAAQTASSVGLAEEGERPDPAALVERFRRLGPAALGTTPTVLDAS